MPIRCLLLGPPATLPERLGEALAVEGFATETVSGADVFRAGARSGRYALGFLHHSWPLAGGVLDVLRDLRLVSKVPCVVVGATALLPAHRVKALDAGADEVLDAAIPLPEAVARVRAVLRRGGPAPSTPWPPERNGWRLSPAVRQMHAPDGESHRLTAAEFDLLRLLVAASGEPVDRDAISRQAFRRAWQPEDRAVDGLVKRLRRKLGPDAIQTSRGLGYALTIEMQSQ